MIRIEGKQSLAAFALVGFSFLAPAAVTAADVSYVFSTLAGVAGTLVSSADGTGSAAQFSAPRGLAVDSVGNVYVADSTNNTIRKITAAGVVTTLAGTAGSSGNTNGTGTAAKFNEPFAVAVDSVGNVFVADTNNNAIRKITPAGVVTTLAGGSGSGTTDGTGTAAKFHEPRAIAIDGSGTLFVADYENHMVRKVTSAGVVTTLAGGADVSGNTDGQGTAARFMALQGLALDGAGNVYVTESGNRDVRKITASGLVTTLASGSGKFGEPRGIAVDSSGNLFVGDYSANVIRKVTSEGIVSNHAGTAPTAGSNDGTLSSALFYGPSGLAIDTAGNLYVADTLNNTVRKISPSGAVTTLAGTAGRTSSVDGSATSARFEDPYSVAVDGSGNLYVADATDHSIRKVTSDGTVTTLAGKGGSFGSTDGTGSAARFKAPLGIAADNAGNVYVADTGNSTLRKITATGVVTTVAGSAGAGGSTDGTGTAARFMSPYGVTVDGAGNVYVVESTAAVRKVTATGVVTTLAGTNGTNGFTNGTGSAARFSVPFDIAVDGAGNLYVSDHGNHAVRMVTPTGVVTTLAGTGSGGKTDGTGTAASFKFPSGIAADSSGTVYLADTDNQVVRKITSAGVVTTIGGTGSTGSADGTGTSASFYNPKDVAVDSSGNLYIVDRGNHTIRKGTLQSVTQAVISASISATTTSGTAPLTVQFTGTGSSTLTSDVLSYLWTFGDGATSTEQNPSHVFTVAGTYSVTLSVSNTTGQSASASAQTITVSTGVSTLIADADKVFVWAEKTYASIFGRGQPTQTITGYRYRSYANGHFLAVNDTGTPHLYYLGPLSNNTVLDLGLLSGWVTQAGM
jgi:PKD repeat protein